LAAIVECDQKTNAITKTTSFEMQHRVD